MSCNDFSARSARCVWYCSRARVRSSSLSSLLKEKGWTAADYQEAQFFGLIPPKAPNGTQAEAGWSRRLQTWLYTGSQPVYSRQQLEERLVRFRAFAEKVK